MKGVLIRSIVQCLILLGGFSFESLDAMDRKEVREKMKQSRPSDLVILLRKPDLGGEYILGMYSLQKDQLHSHLRRFKLWEESPFDLNVYSEAVSCKSEEPIRIKRQRTEVYVRRLNPGGLVNRVNREDHLVWWAACMPDFAGVDPSTLTNQALKLGYSTILIESQEILKRVSP